MQIKSLRVKSYRSWRIDDNTSAEALGRLKQLEWVERLRGEGCSEATSLAVVGWSRATYYRWLRRYREDGLKGLESGTRAPRRRRVCQWTKQQAQQVLHLRKRYPLWGKRKLWRVLVRERGWTLSESTVGRIVARLVRLGRVEPVSFYYGQVKPKRRRRGKYGVRRQWTSRSRCGGRRRGVRVRGSRTRHGRRLVEVVVGGYGRWCWLGWWCT